CGCRPGRRPHGAPVGSTTALPPDASGARPRQTAPPRGAARTPPRDSLPPGVPETLSHRATPIGVIDRQSILARRSRRAPMIMDAHSTPIQGSPALEPGLYFAEPPRAPDFARRYGERFARRVYTPEEWQAFHDRPPSLAARFAAKEAVIKALGS